MTSPYENKHTADTHTRPSDPSYADDPSVHRLGSSAQQIWLAGLGALGRMQSEGSRFFAALVRDGEAYEQRQRDQFREKTAHVRDRVEGHIDDAVDGARRGWGRLSRAVDDRLHAALRSLNLPHRHELDALRGEVDALRAEVQRLNAQIATHQSYAASHPTQSSVPSASE